MARKQLIRGTNATRLEARITRVPDEDVPQADDARSIFGALAELEGGVPPRSAPKTASPGAAPPKLRAPKAADIARPEARIEEPRIEEPRIEEPKSAAPKPAKPTMTEAAKTAAPKGKLRASDFTAAERREILVCCLDYRNHLPIYLLSAKKEVELIDSIIEKCGGRPPG